MNLLKVLCWRCFSKFYKSEVTSVYWNISLRPGQRRSVGRDFHISLIRRMGHWHFTYLLHNHQYIAPKKIRADKKHLVAKHTLIDLTHFLHKSAFRIALPGPKSPKRGTKPEPRGPIVSLYHLRVLVIALSGSEAISLPQTACFPLYSNGFLSENGPFPCNYYKTIRGRHSFINILVFRYFLNSQNGLQECLTIWWDDISSLFECCVMFEDLRQVLDTIHSQLVTCVERHRSRLLKENCWTFFITEYVNA